jgi:hypothetical protein
MNFPVDEMRVLLLCIAMVAVASPASSQVVADSLFTWRAYAREGTTHVRVFRNPSDDDRPHTIVVQEVAANRGPSSTADARHLVEVIGRAFVLDPTTATWVFHWGSFSFAGAEDSSRELLLRATFRRLPSGNLSTPSWRLLSRIEVETLTGRRF